MRQVLQDLRTGEIEVADVPVPAARAEHLLVRTAASLISPGTERMLLEFGRAGWVGRARSQPERVRQALAKVRTDGLAPTLEAIASRLEEPVALGYCNVGRVLEVGPGVRGFRAGDRVVSNAPHAGVVCVPATLAAVVPDPVPDDEAAFTVLGAISLNGIRLLEPTFGETFAVVGLGLLGLLSVQLLRASGCRVVAIDVDPARVERARAFGADVACVIGAAGGGGAAAAEQAAREATGGVGVDGVVIAAAAQGDEVVASAARMCRKRGRIVLVGVVGLRLERNLFYEKELSFRVACSYGPGRYDPEYEVGGKDYPLAFVRWTAARNFEAVLEALARRSLDVRPLLSHRFAVDEAARAYDVVVAERSALGVLLEFGDAWKPDGVLERVVRVAGVAEAHEPMAVRLHPAQGGADAGSTAPARTRVARSDGWARRPRTGARSQSAQVVGLIGSGQFARRVLLPALVAGGARIEAIASAGGVSSLMSARRFGAAEATTDLERVIESPSIDAVVIATRHDSHARLAAAALRAGKHVLVEKPLALTVAEIEEVRRAHDAAPDRILAVGFNRRFAPLAMEAQALLATRSEPLAIVATVNAGAVPPGHWTVDPTIGGGRVLGEGCHFVDLARFLVGRPIAQVRAFPLGLPGHGAACGSATIHLAFTDGSTATVHYLTNGSASFPKERVEIASQGRVLAIDNWRRMRPYDWPGARRRWWRQDKGHQAFVLAFLRAVAGERSEPIPFAEIEEVSLATLEAARQAARTGTGADAASMASEHAELARAESAFETHVRSAPEVDATPCIAGAEDALPAAAAGGFGGGAA